MDYFDRRDNVCMYEEEINKFNNFGHNEVEDSEIQTFFEDKNVFITGATGLIGSTLLENLLRSCPKIGKIYLLLRQKKDQPQKERLQELLCSKMFYRVNKIYEDVKSKIQIIYGDCAQPWCGLSECDKQMLINNVHIVYHSAATTDQNLINAYYINVRATEHLLAIATKMKVVEAFIYISTAYTQAFDLTVKENFYQTLYSENELELLGENFNDKEIAAITPRIVGKRINSYTFTKAVAEEVVHKYIEKVPVAIARASNVVTTYNDPIVNWIKNISGLTGGTSEGFMGASRLWRHGRQNILDIIPSENVAKAIIAMSWQIGNHRTNGIPVYNLVPLPNSEIISWKERTHFLKHFIIAYHTFFSTQSHKDGKVKHKEGKLTKLLTACIPYVMSEIVPYAYQSTNGEPSMLLKPFINIYDVYTNFRILRSKDYVLENENMGKIWSKMSNTDKELFNFNMTINDWEQFKMRYDKWFKDFLSERGLLNLDKYGRLNKNLITSTGLKIIIFGITIYHLPHCLMFLLKICNTLFL